MKLQRNVGQTSQILLLFVQDVSVTTGAGLANVIGSSVSYTWFHNNQISVTTGTASTAGTTGTYSTSAWTMISSSNALGWYQFGAPDGVFATGDCVGIHFYGAPNMVPLPVEIELTRDNNQQFVSSKVFLALTSTSPANITQAVGQPIVTSGAGILNVSTQAIDKGGYGVTTVSATITTNANVIQAYGSAIVTSASGQFLVSTQAIDKGGYGVTTVSAAITTNANVIQAYGSAIVTSASGQFLVSTQAIDKGGYGVTTIAATITTNANVIQAYGSAIVTSASGQFRVSTQSLVGIVVSTQTIDKTGYDVTSFYAQPAVTSGAGILNVSTQALAAGAGDIISVYGQPIVTTAAGVIRVSTQSLAGIVVSTQSLVGIVVSTQTVDKTGYTVTAADKAAMMAVISSTTISETYRASSDIGSIPQLMYEMLANVTDFANSGTTRALNSVTSHATGTLQYQYDSTTPSAITRIA